MPYASSAAFDVGADLMTSLDRNGLSCHGGTRHSIPFTDDREFETRGNYLVDQWPEVLHDAKFDLCFGMPREQVAHRADRHRFHLALGNPVASVRELQPEQRRVELVGIESTVPNPIQPSRFYRMQSPRTAKPEKFRTLVGNRASGPAAGAWAITRKPKTGRVLVVNGPDEWFTFIRSCCDVRPKQTDRWIF